MSLNWMHTSIYASEPVLNELHDAIKPHVHKADDLDIHTDKEGNKYLFTDSWEEEKITNSIEDISKKHPDEVIGVRYLDSSPGAYHEVKSTYQNGIETVNSDTVEYVDISLEDDMANFMNPEA